jgi:acyl transferase domain-containing protein/SAM-dependent methyltransferase
MKKPNVSWRTTWMPDREPEPMSERTPDTLSPTKRALYELRTTRDRLKHLEESATEPMAVIGFGLRFPGGAVDAESFWRLLADGADAITAIPPSRWDAERYFDPNPDTPGRMSTRHGGFLDDVDRFDAPFFNISRREAEAMDPQQRLLLEVAWEALEDAGQNPQGLVGSATGVFLAMSNSDYSRLAFRDPRRIDVYSTTGVNFSVGSGRLSFLLGLSGPSLTVDTACSGSLVSVHLACQSLRAGESRLALAGGVNLILSPEVNINFSRARMMAPDGHCKTFDAAADGYVRGEGCGIVVLKRLRDALADGDRVLALIRGSAVNQDGRSSGLTVPNGPAQEAVIATALSKAGVEPSAIDYVEAHGTGTALGDPIEAHALCGALGPGRSAEHPLVIGCVKTNVGHLESAAGVAGLIKVILALQHEWIPAHRNFTTLNPHIDWRGIPVEIPVQGRQWVRGSRRRLAGVSSFGFSGTNAHLVVEEAPSHGPASTMPERPVGVLAVSAATESALAHVVTRLTAHLDTHPDATRADLCASANTGRAALTHRAAYLAATREELRRALDAPPVASGAARGTPGVAFLFTGQGAQFAGMGRQLYEIEPVFRAAIDRCAALMAGEIDLPLTALLWGDQAHRLEEDTTYIQPALFALQWALAQLWHSWGVQPRAVLGHSVGEYAAACVAGAYTLADGVRLICSRARLTGSLPRNEGAMSVLLAPAPVVHAALAARGGAAVVAAINGPDNLTISGPCADVEAVEAKVAAAGYRVERLRVSHAFHSPMMAPIERALEADAADVAAGPPEVTLVSTVTGEVVTGEIAAAHWRRQVRDCVRFDAALQTLSDQGCDVFVEIGPGSTLLGLAQPRIDREGQVWTPSIRRARTAVEQMAESAAAIWVRGVPLNWTAYEAGRGNKVPLPTYPFERQRYWLEASQDQVADEEAVWIGVEESATRQASQGRFDLDISSYARRWACLDQLTTAFISRTLVELGAFVSGGERYTLDTLVRTCGIAGGHRRLVQRWLDRLVDRGLLSRSGAAYTNAAPLGVPDVAALTTEADVVFGADRVFLDYVVACGRDLPAVVTGRMSALETLFPGGEFTRAEALYEHAPLSSYFSSIARAVLEAVVRGRAAAPIRVIEVGAGTGATTSALLPVLPPGAAYCFTDVSDLFLHHGRRKFAGQRAVTYARLDIESGASDEIALGGSFDVVVATNVIHAAADLDKALANVRALLAPGGLLILCEATRQLSWFDITTGLIEGWQRFDDRWRTDQPLIPPQTWTAALAAAGFERTAVWPAADSPAGVLGQHVIVARAPGAWVATAAVPAVAETAVEKPVDTAGGGNDWIAQLERALPDARRDMLVDLVRRQIAAVLRVPIDAIDTGRRFAELGVDSLMALEFRRRVSSALSLSVQLPATIVFDHPTVEHVAAFLERQLLPEQPVEAPSGEGTSSARVSVLERMADEEAESLLLQMLQGRRGIA